MHCFWSLFAARSAADGPCFSKVMNLVKRGPLQGMQHSDRCRMYLCIPGFLPATERLCPYVVPTPLSADEQYVLARGGLHKDPILLQQEGQKEDKKG